MLKSILARLTPSGTPMWAMSNMKSTRTGLPGSIGIWIGPACGASHGPRIKVSNVRGKFPSNESDYFSVTISDSPETVAGSPLDFSSKELKAVFDWVRLNRVPLLEFWNSDTMDFDDIKPKLKKLR